MPYKKNQRLEIEWLDVVDNSEWQSEEEACKVDSETYCKTIGYFLKETELFIWLSWSISARKRKGERSTSMIPKGVITKIRELKPLRRTK